MRILSARKLIAIIAVASSLTGGMTGQIANAQTSGPGVRQLISGGSTTLQINSAEGSDAIQSPEFPKEPVTQ